jgi:hypothetical protein
MLLSCSLRSSSAVSPVDTVLPRSLGSACKSPCKRALCVGVPAGLHPHNAAALAFSASDFSLSSPACFSLFYLGSGCWRRSCRSCRFCSAAVASASAPCAAAWTYVIFLFMAAAKTEALWHHRRSCFHPADRSESACHSVLVEGGQHRGSELLSVRATCSMSVVRLLRRL